MSNPLPRTLRALPGGLGSRQPRLRPTTPSDLDALLGQLDVAIAGASTSDLPSLAFAVAARLASVASLLLERSESDTTRAPAAGSRYVTPDEAATIAGVSRRWIYRNTRGEPFRKDLSRKQVRLHEADFRSWLAGRGTGPSRF
ncbi:MAG: helix-turn-helix domain-containing protein [Acidobacteriota bacterium]